MAAETEKDLIETSTAFAYSPVWRLLAFLVPAALFFFVIRNLKRIGMEQAYLVVAFASAAVTLGPHLFIAATLSGSFRIGPEGVSRLWFGLRRTLAWSKILECRDFLNQIQIIPARQADTIYLQFYNNLVRPVTFHTTLMRYATKYEVNLMMRPTTRRFLPIRWRSILLLALIIGTGVVLVAARKSRTPAHEAAMLVGLVAGCTYTTLSVALWMTISKSHKRIRAQRLVFYAVYAVVLLLPLLVLSAREATRNRPVDLILFAFAYLFGYFSGSGLLGLFYPNRDLEPKHHAAEVLSGRNS